MNETHYGTDASDLTKAHPSLVAEFEGWPKMPRLFKDMVITEKIDGTNAQILITEDGIMAGSRKRWLSSATDNHGFGRWVGENAGALIRLLGPGRHFGEWWGQGIQRRYNMKYKVFSLFNTIVRPINFVASLLGEVLAELPRQPRQPEFRRDPQRDRDL